MNPQAIRLGKLSVALARWLASRYQCRCRFLRQSPGKVLKFVHRAASS
jgi:hypothetical protein